MCWLVFSYGDELARFQPSLAFLGGEARPFGRILAGGIAVGVVGSEVEVAVHAYCDKRAVGLKGDAVLAYEVILIGDIPAGARGLKVLHLMDCTELVEEEGFLDGLHNEKGLMIKLQ